MSALVGEPAPPGAAERAARPLTGPFWAAVDERRLVRPVCDRCRRSFFTPRVACPRCQSTAWTYRPSTGRGTVASHTTVHRPPDPAFPAPYVLAVVDVVEDDPGDPGWYLLTWVVAGPPEGVGIGLPVRVEFVAGPDGLLLPAFAPDPRPAATALEGSSR